MNQLKKVDFSQISYFCFLFCFCLLLFLKPVDVHAFEMQYLTPSGYVPFSQIDDTYKPKLADKPMLFKLLNNGIGLPSVDNRVLLVEQWNQLFSSMPSTYDVYPINNDFIAKESHYIMWQTTAKNTSYSTNNNGGLFYKEDGSRYVVPSAEAESTNIYFLLIYGSDSLANAYDWSLNNSTSNYTNAIKENVLIRSNSNAEFWLTPSSNTSVNFWYQYLVSLDGQNWYIPYYPYHQSTNSYNLTCRNGYKTAFQLNINNDSTILFSDLELGDWVKNNTTNIYDWKVIFPASPLPDDALNGLNNGSNGDSGTTDPDDPDNPVVPPGGDSGDTDGTLTEDEKDQNIIEKALTAIFGDGLKYGQKLVETFENLWNSFKNVFNSIDHLLSGDTLSWMKLEYVKDYVIVGVYLTVILIIFAWLPLM